MCVCVCVCVCVAWMTKASNNKLQLLSRGCRNLCICIFKSWACFPVFVWTVSLSHPLVLGDRRHSPSGLLSHAFSVSGWLIDVCIHLHIFILEMTPHLPSSHTHTRTHTCTHTLLIISTSERPAAQPPWTGVCACEVWLCSWDESGSFLFVH